MARDTLNRDLQSFSRVLNEYLAYNKREQGPLLENRANRIRWGLYRKFRDLAQSPESLEAYLQDRIRSGRGIWRGKTRGGKTRTIEQEIRARKRSVRYLSLSWLMSKWRASRTGQNATIGQRSRTGRRIGEIVLRTAQGSRNPQVELTSFLEGVVIQNREKGIVEEVLRDEVANMRTYISRKQKEQFRRLARRWAIGS